MVEEVFRDIYKNIEQSQSPAETTDFKFVVITVFITVHRESPEL